MIKYQYTQEQEQWLLENHDRYPSSYTTKFKEKFNVDIPAYSIRSKYDRLRQGAPSFSEKREKVDAFLLAHTDELQQGIIKHREVEERFGVSSTFILSRKKALGLFVCHNEVPAELPKYLLQHRGEIEAHKISTSDIAKMFSISCKSVYNYVRQLGFNMRSNFYYTEEMNVWLRNYYPITDTKILTKMFNETFNVSLDAVSIRNHSCVTLGLNKEHRVQYNQAEVGSLRVRKHKERKVYYIKVLSERDTAEQSRRWAYVPEEVYENNKLVSNCALAHVTARRLEKKLNNLDTKQENDS